MYEAHQHGDHEHHLRSKKRNIVIGCGQLAVGVLYGSMSSFVAGSHNLIDGRIHKWRHEAAISADTETKQRNRRKIAGLFAATGVASFFIEKYSGINEASSWLLPTVFATETIVNAASLGDSLKHSNGSTDSVSAIMHNGLDTLTSAATMMIVSTPLVVESFNESVADSIAGYGHLMLLGALSIHALRTSKQD